MWWRVIGATEKEGGVSCGGCCVGGVMWWRVMGATDKEGGVSCGGGQAVMGVGSWGVIGVSGKEGDVPLVSARAASLAMVDEAPARLMPGKSGLTRERGWFKEGERVRGHTR